MTRKSITIILVIIFMVSYASKIVFAGNDEFAKVAKDCFTASTWLLLGWLVWWLLPRSDEKYCSKQKGS